ncbi:MAG: DMT family transporter [Minisyncoccia bacterium]|jgi:drug/metabolite transporter (DMT)-like permease
MGNFGFVYAVGAALTWGLVYALDQKILSGSSPLAYLFINSLFTAILVLPFLFFDGGSIKTIFSSRGTILWLIVASVVLAALANFLIFSGIKILGASTASIIEIAYPFFVVLFSFIIFRSTPNIYFLLGGALIFVGSIIIIKFA